MRWHIAGFEMHLRGALVVAGDEAKQNLGEKAPLLHTETSHDAEIDRHQLASVIDKQVAGMHVGMKKAVAQRMTQEGLNHRAREALEIQSPGFEQRAVGERRRVDPFE